MVSAEAVSAGSLQLHGRGLSPSSGNEMARGQPVRKRGSVPPPVITLTTDFGSGDYVAAMRGVILGVNPRAVIVDLDHGIRAHDIRHGAYALFAAAPFFPNGIHVGVVDPGVGTERRPVAFLCKDGAFVGPDNGLLFPAARQAAIRQVRHLTNRKLFRPGVSDTFHGRDIFAPVAAHLSLGLQGAKLGPVIDDYVRLDFGAPIVSKTEVRGSVLTVDRFGNVITNIPRAAIEDRTRSGRRLRAQVGGYELELSLLPAYGLGRVGEFLATFSSSGFLEIARREGRAADQLAAAPGTPVAVQFSG